MLEGNRYQNITLSLARVGRRRTVKASSPMRSIRGGKGGRRVRWLYVPRCLLRVVCVFSFLCSLRLPLLSYPLCFSCVVLVASCSLHHASRPLSLLAFFVSLFALFLLLWLSRCLALCDCCRLALALRFLPLGWSRLRSSGPTHDALVSLVVLGLLCFAVAVCCPGWRRQPSPRRV